MYFGAQYYRPPFPGKEVWNRDLARMKALGFNVVKHWAVWNWIEREPGGYDFRELEELVALSKEHGLKVILNLIPEGAPYWTSKGYEASLYQTAEGELLKYSGPANIPSAGWPGLCPDSPEGERLITAFIRAAAFRFAENDNVIAIDVWNEPHLEPMFDYSGRLLCYCAHSAARFTAWLQARYGSLSRLNEAWFRAYTDWSQVEPPRRFGTSADMMDWRRFWLQNLARWLRFRVKAAREGAPGKPIQTHTAFSAYMGANNEGGLGNELGDEFLLAKEVDVFGLSSFPLWLMGDDHVNGHFINTEIIAEAARGKPFYQVELQGGPGKAGLLGGLTPTADDIRQWNLSVLASGGKGVVYWQYAPEPAGMESPGFGLCNPDGGGTARMQSAGDCARKYNLETLDQAKRVLSSNGIYLSRNADLLCYAMGDEKSYHHSFEGIWRLLLEEGIPCRFVHGDYGDKLLEEGMRCLYLPMALCLSKEEQESLLSFVRGGGRLIVEAGTGMYGENGQLDPDSTFLDALFGMRGVCIEKAKEKHAFETTAGCGAFHSVFYWQGFSEIGDGCRILARFESGEPAALERRYGEGTAVWIGGFVGHGYHGDQDPDVRGFLGAFFEKTGYAPVEDLRADGMPVRLLETETDYIAVCLNRTANAKKIELRLAGQAYQAEVPAKDGTLLTIPKHLRPRDCHRL